MFLNSRIWHLGNLGPYEMGLLSEAMCSVWPSLQSPYSGCTIYPQELWLAMFDLLDRPRTVDKGEASILHIKYHNGGRFSRQSGEVFFAPHSRRNKFCFGQQENGCFFARIDFGRRSVEAASQLLEDLTRKNLHGEIDYPELGRELETTYLFGGLKVSQATRNKLEKAFGNDFLTEVEAL